MKRKIRLYLHNHHYEPIEVKQNLSPKDYLITTVRAGGNFIFYICYGIGFAIILFPKALLHFLKLARNPELITDQLRVVFAHTGTRQSFKIFLALLVASNGLFLTSEVIAKGQLLKARVVSESGIGLSSLQDATLALQSNNFTRAEEQFKNAIDNFNNSRRIISDTNIALKAALTIAPQGQDAKRLLEAVDLVAKLGLNATKTLALVNQIKIGPQGISGTDNPKVTLETIMDFASDSENKITRVEKLLSKINVSSLPADKQALFVVVKDNIAMVKQSVVAFNSTMQIAGAVLLGNKTILLAFLNNNELRPGGGFVGTIGSAKINDGVMSQLDVRTVYDYDGQLRDLITMPTPMLIANNRWYLRDTNWFADNRVNAVKLAKLFEKSGGSKPDFAITVTPDFVIEALRRTGPISLPQHNVTLTADNFIETVQTATSLYYDKFLNQPKQVLADFVPALLQKLSDQEGSMQYFANLLFSQLAEKNVSVFSFNPDVEKLIEDYNWSGSIRETDRDYLSIIHANLGGTKTDRELVKTVNLESTVEKDGSISNELSYTVQNPLPDVPGLANKSFIRFLLPKNTEILKAEGFDKIDIPVPQKDIRYINDNDVKAWNDSFGYNENLQGYIGTESNKTYYGNWLEVKGGESKTVKLTYKLPFKLKKIDKHSITVQKQIGSTTNLNYNLKYRGRIAGWHNQEFETVDAENVKISKQLNRDIFAGIVLKLN